MAACAIGRNVEAGRLADNRAATVDPARERADRDAREGKPAAATRPRPLLAAAHLAALWALAFAQPLFDLLGRNTAFFVARGNTAGEILAFALIFTLGPFLVAWLVEAVLEKISARLRWAVHLALLALLVGCLILQLIGQFTQRPAGLMILVSLAGGVGIATFYARGRFLKSVLDVLTPAPLIVLALFLVLGPTSKLVLPGNEPEPARVEVANPAPVVVMIFDEFPLGSVLTPGGEIDATRFPNLAEVARTGTWYRNATTSGAFTTLGVPALLTGRRPAEDDLPVARDQPESIFTLLAGSYELSVKEDATKLCPEKLCPEAEAHRTVQAGLGPLFDDLWVVSRHLLYPEALREGLPDISETFGGFAADVDGVEATGVAAGGDAHVVAMALAREVKDDEEVRVRDFAEGIKAGEEPTLHLIHVEKPHYPWRHLPDGRLYSPDQGEWIRFLDENSIWQAPESVTDIALQRHLLEAGYVDSMLGKVIDRMKQVGIWDEALFVVAADHGGAMMAGIPRRNPHPENLGQVAPVPLIIKAPGQSSAEAEVVDRHACLTEVLPEIAEQLGIEYPWGRDECPPDTVTVADLPNGKVEASFEEVLRQRDEYVERIDRLFGTGRGWGAVLRPRAGRSLLGKHLPLLPADPEMRAIPDEQVREYRPAARKAPALLQRGELVGIEPGSPIAVTVDGRVAAVGTSFELEGAVVYSILLPPDSLSPGDNEIGINLLVREGVEAKLQPLDS